MKITIVGSRTLDLEEAVGPLFKEILRLPEDTQVLIRERQDGDRGQFEELTAKLAKSLNIQVLPMRPIGPGRGGVYERDMAMVEASDAVLAFFDPAHVMVGGTGHVVEKAIDKEVPTWAYQVDENGYTEIGGIEPPEDSDILQTWRTPDSSFQPNSSQASIGGSTSGPVSGSAKSRSRSTSHA